MKLKKTFIKIWTVLPVCLLLISFFGMSFSLEAFQTMPTDTASRETDRLFRKMDIIKVPHIAPPVDFNLLDLNGNTVNLSDFKGKIVFLNFWTTWCPACRVEMPMMQKLYTHFKYKDFAMVAISMNEPASTVKRFFKDHKLTFTVLLDSNNKLGTPFGIRGIPTTYIMDRDGGIIGKALGPRQWDSKESIALFEHLISRVDQNIKTNEHEQKKGISSNSVKSDTGIGNSADDPTYTA